jgi:anti-sigma-K factor RskA
MNPREERLLELLCDGTLVGLTPTEETEVAALLREAGPHGDWEKHAQALERAAAAISVAGSLHPREPMPAHLFARIEQQALKALERASVPMAPPAASPAPIAPPVPIQRARRWRGAIPWMAAAACLLLAIGSWRWRPREVVVTKEVLVPAAVPSESAAPAPPPPEAGRRELLARDGTVQSEWSATKEAAAKDASGDVIWNQKEQRGFMRFHGLARNDPKASQYQLWIFDETRDARYPVDGGVFDVDDGSGDVIVPIHATIPVGAPTLFAVTVEKPGGVVVSKREHIVLTAKTHA